MRRFLAVASAVTLSTIMTTQLRAQAKPDTLVKPAVIYRYDPPPGVKFTKDSTAPVVKKPAPTPDSSTVTLLRSGSHGITVFQTPLPDSVVRWMKDTVAVRLEGRRKDMVIGEPRVRGDTAWVQAQREPQNIADDRTYVFAIEYLFVRRGGVWTLTNRLSMQHLHGIRTPASPNSPVKVDTAAIQRIALAYLKADSNYVRSVDRRPLQIRGDTAFATFFYGAEVSVVLLEKRDGKWVPTYHSMGVK